MTNPADIRELGGRLQAGFDESGFCLIVSPEKLLDTAKLLKDPSTADFEYLDMITAVDYPDCFELVYRFLSFKNNQLVILKTRVGRDNPTVPSLTSLWKGADFQEREIYDLFGIHFNGHPCLRRIMLWEGFQGHPLRKDYSCGS